METYTYNSHRLSRQRLHAVRLIHPNTHTCIQDNAAGPVVAGSSAANDVGGAAAGGTSVVFATPGGKIKPGEGEADGLARKLKRKLGPTNEIMDYDFEVRPDLVLATYYR